MVSIKTLYRAGVMVATAIIVFKGWQHYGPTTEQMKTGAARALEVAHEVLNHSQSSNAPNEPATIDPRSALPMIAATAESSSPTTSGVLTPPPLSGTPTLPAAQAEPPRLLPENQDSVQTSVAESEKLPALMSRLEALGAADPKLAAWGSSGKLYRFCCRAKLEDSAAYAKHFESVAEEPAAAVEQVVAKVEAWRLAQNGRHELR